MAAATAAAEPQIEWHINAYAPCETGREAILWMAYGEWYSPELRGYVSDSRHIRLASTRAAAEAAIGEMRREARRRRPRGRSNKVLAVASDL